MSGLPVLSSGSLKRITKDSNRLNDEQLWAIGLKAETPLVQILGSKLLTNGSIRCILFDGSVTLRTVMIRKSAQNEEKYFNGELVVYSVIRLDRYLVSAQRSGTTGAANDYDILIVLDFTFVMRGSKVNRKLVAIPSTAAADDNSDGDNTDTNAVHNPNTSHRVVKPMARAFNKQKTSDLKLKLIDKNTDFKYIYVHKWFLSENSKHFESMFSNELTESVANNEIIVEEYSYRSYYQFIRFLYTDTIDTKDIDVLVELLDIGNEYLDKRLQQKCFETIKRVISVDNVCDLYSGAVRYNCSDLENYCFNFMSKYMDLLCETEGYKRLDQTIVQQFNKRYLDSKSNNILYIRI